MDKKIGKNPLNEGKNTEIKFFALKFTIVMVYHKHSHRILL